MKVRILQSLLSLDLPLSEIKSNLLKFSWSEEEEAELTCEHIVNVLGKFLDRTISSETLIAWADTIEGRSDIAFNEEHELIIKSFIFEAANPEINEIISVEWARNWQSVFLSKLTED